MNNLPDDPIGAAWLVREFSITPFAQLPVLSRIGGRRATHIENGFRLETFVESMRPDSEAAAHLQFHLRHETPHFEFLARLFKSTGPSFVQAWIVAEPTGQYARRAAFLYEWLTSDELGVPERVGGNYVDALNESTLVTASPDHVRKDARWRVNDNLPGTRYFCPMLVKTQASTEASSLDVKRLFDDLTAEFGEDVLLRSAAWMTLRESKASFAIEGEGDQTGRVQRFADVMARRTGRDEVPLTDVSLANLQEAILGGRTTLTHFGLRESPVFVGETIRYEEVVHYIAPPATDLEAMLHGLRTFLLRTQGQSSVMRSAVAAFGFVYIHPLADGNGRVHRFLINDVLRRDGVIPDPVILPLSAVITDDPFERRNYDRVLDSVSRPMMQTLREAVAFESKQTTYPDGVVSNFVFHGIEQARPAWRYPAMGEHVVFLANVIKRTLTEYMRDESRYLRGHARARAALKEVIEMPDQQADRVLRSIEQNRGELTNMLAKEMPVLLQREVWVEIVEAVSRAWADDRTPTARP